MYGDGPHYPEHDGMYNLEIDGKLMHNLEFI